jgi:hypothetical protein
MTNKWRCFPIALCVLSLACGKKPEATDKGGPAAGKPSAAVEAPSPVPEEAPKGTYIAKFRLGPAFGPEGTVNADVSMFRPGEPVFTSFEIANAPAGSKVRVAWALLPDKKPLARQEAPLSPDKPAVAFKADSRGWPIGDYQFEIALVEPGKEDGRAMGTAPFKIVREKLR